MTYSPGAIVALHVGVVAPRVRVPLRAHRRPPARVRVEDLCGAGRKLHRVGPNCETRPNTLTENPY
jgi:hypothetical protein